MKKQVLLGAALLLFSTSSLAEAGRAQPSTLDDDIIRNMDTNRDGMVSRDEFMRRQQQMFDAADKQGKGQLNRDEAKSLLSMERSGMPAPDARARMRDEEMERGMERDDMGQRNQPSNPRGMDGSPQSPGMSNQPMTRGQSGQGGMPSDTMRDREMRDSD